MFDYFLSWRFCAFLSKGSSKAPQKKSEKNSCQKLLTKKLKGRGGLFSFDFLNRIFGCYSALCCMRSAKTPLKQNLKTLLKNLEKSQRKIGR
jgi:hypothetical protein